MELKDSEKYVGVIASDVEKVRSTLGPFRDAN